ncbi:hypothetical protein LINGRAHAP2_LOCUS5661, partial [Linum grandiflorum]
APSTTRSTPPVIPPVVDSAAATAPVAPLPSLTADHPYFISTSDNHGVLLVSVPISSSNDYHSWARTMRMSLLSKNKLSFVDGTAVAAAPTWKRANVLVLSWLHRSVSPEIAQSVLWLDSARNVWLDLQDIILPFLTFLKKQNFYFRKDVKTKLN